MLIAMQSLMRAIVWIPLINAAREHLALFNDSVGAWLVFVFYFHYDDLIMKEKKQLLCLFPLVRNSLNFGKFSNN